MGRVFSGQFSVVSGRMGLCVVIFAGCLWLPTNAQAQNFLSPDVELVKLAESARVRSARYWSGSELPGRWTVACPIAVTPATHSGGGRTDFTFGNGEVFGWRMAITGRRENLIADVLPHEVDHMVRASLVRHPVERWLDEGCASLFESPESHAQLRREAAQRDAGIITADWLAARDYPSTPGGQQAVYSVGFSLVEFLLSRGGPQKLLTFQRETGGVEDRLQRHYGLNVAALRQEWDLWRRSRSLRCADCRCPQHGLPPGESAVAKGPLWIWWADWCEPCRRLHADLNSDSEFRRALESKFDVRWIDFDRQPVQARLNGVTTLPTLIHAQGRVVGYPGSTELLRQLGLDGVPLKSQMPTADDPVETPPLAVNPPQVSGAKEEPVVPEETPPRATSWWKLIPATFTLLQWTGILGGTFATGGVGGIALGAAWALWQGARRRRLARSAAEASGKGVWTAGPAPFPRKLDEARELCELRKSEGRVAVLDTLRGMFLDDELEKLETSGDAALKDFSRQLRSAIDGRVDEIAPLSVEAAS